MTPPTTTAKRYFRWAATAVVAYLLSSAGAAWLAAATGRSRLLAIVALLPATSVLAVVWTTARYLSDETDAVQRAIQIEATSWAIGVTFCIATAWGLLGAFVAAPQPPSWCAFAVFCSVVASVQLARRLFPRR